MASTGTFSDVSIITMVTMEALGTDGIANADAVVKHLENIELVNLETCTNNLLRWIKQLSSIVECIFDNERIFLPRDLK